MIQKLYQHCVITICIGLVAFSFPCEIIKQKVCIESLKFYYYDKDATTDRLCYKMDCQKCLCVVARLYGMSGASRCRVQQ
jgi:hypothetical protein